MLNLLLCCMSVLCNAVRNFGGRSALGDHVVADLLSWKACLSRWRLNVLV